MPIEIWGCRLLPESARDNLCPRAQSSGWKGSQPATPTRRLLNIRLRAARCDKSNKGAVPISHSFSPVNLGHSQLVEIGEQGQIVPVRQHPVSHFNSNLLADHGISKLRP